MLRANGVGTAEFGAGPATVTQRLRGTVRRGVARGTLSATLVLTETATGAKHTCRSGSLRWEAFSNPGHVYAGLTSDGRPVVVQRSRNGRKVDAFWVSFNAPCQKEGGFAIGEELLNFPLSSGAFGDTWTYEPDPKTSAAYSLRGRVGASTRVRDLPGPGHRQGRRRRARRHLRHHAAALERALDQGREDQAEEGGDPGRRRSAWPYGHILSNAHSPHDGRWA